MSYPQGFELFNTKAVFAQHNAVASYLDWDFITQEYNKQY